ncbi:MULTISPECIES: N-acetyl sugar amidotransferase [Lysinibacillus]|uniref:N-acetyl sugar amidotransferase n=1 Tax=Lysinibacillus TaxID=400634 RepID=UPI002582F6F1|nr:MULTISPECIES: N-acetyl sugar amidotransferase [Lysinibacillus]
MIKYCKKCVLPNTKPHLIIDDEGVCDACRNFENRETVDWQLRKQELIQILDKYKSKDGSNWDCIVPVSGGKDSTYQVIKLLEFGMNPLCITSTTCHLTEIGRKNIENIKDLGVDYIEITANKIVRKKLNRIGLREVGDISWPEHAGIFTVPVKMAVKFNVPLLIWGENPQNEYGGPAASNKNISDREFLDKYAGLLGLDSKNLLGKEELKEKDLIPYTYPTNEELETVGVTGLFLGYYLPWDGYTNYLLSQAHGFTSWGKTIEGSAVDYENLDNYQTGIHDYFKFLKFGYGRASDLVSMHIRRGRLTREEGMKIVRKHDGQFPWSYLDKPLEEIIEPLEISLDEFISICDKFTNKALFKVDDMGNLVKDNQGNLQKINDDNII